MVQHKILKTLHHHLIVSVQANQGEPLNKPECLLAMAMAAVQGGAKGLRLANPDNIQLIKEYLPEIPVIGITKPPHPQVDPENHVYITPGLWAAETVAMAGAEIVAMDATQRPRPTGETLAEIVPAFKERFPGTLLMADVATVEEGRAAEALGFDVVSTTLSGYTAETIDKSKTEAPDFELLQALTHAVSIPVILEGRIWTPEQVAHAFDLDAFAVVIGSAVTRPQIITQRFVQALPHLNPAPSHNIS